MYLPRGTHHANERKNIMKTKKIKVRQGFTIVELVIVIGVIGVLSAVLIPTFINLNQKANQAADESLVKNLNTQLAMRKQTEGANRTMSEALADALDAGYKVENLTPKGNKDIVWNQETDQFAQLESAPAEDAYKYWTVAKKASDLEKGYSSYLYYQPEGDITTTAGFDVGEYKDINVTYNKGASAKTDVRIRTRGGSLKINADTDTVSHWAELDDLNIEAVAAASYHEYGFVKQKAIVNQGHLVIEQQGSIPQVEVKSVPSGKTAKVTANEKTVIMIDEGSKEAASVVANVADVFVEGAKEGSISGQKAAEVKLPTLIMNEADLRNQANGFAKLGADIAIATDSPIAVSSKCVLDLNGHNITYGEDMSDETELYHINTNAEMSVIGNGKITANARIFYAEGDFRVESGTFVTTVVGNSASKRSIVISKKGSNVTINGGDFYSAKGNLYLCGTSEINGGTFTSIASTSFNKTASEFGNDDATDSYAYSIFPVGDTTINGGTVYGIQGGICHSGGKLVINNVYSEASTEAMTRYKAVQSTIHYINRKDLTIDLTGEVATGTVHYALYSAGESFTVNCTINGGEFVAKGPNTSVYVGNSTYGDGGERLPAFVAFNGGKFVSENTTYVVAVDKNVGTAQIAGGNFNKSKIKAGSSVVELADASNILASGYHVEPQTDGSYSVVKN